MSIQEQEQIKSKYYNEAVRYMDNAKECLKNAKKDGKFYRDPKYIRMACGTAYSGVLIALDGFMMSNGIAKPKAKERKSIEHYQNQLGQLDRKILNHLNSAYHILHLSGYYDGIDNAVVLKEGFDQAFFIINKIKPKGID
jgi:hypothetical protein